MGLWKCGLYVEREEKESYDVFQQYTLKGFHDHSHEGKPGFCEIKKISLSAHF